MNQSPQTDKTHDFLVMARVGSGIGFGAMIAILWSLEGSRDGGLTYKIGFGSFVAFAVGVAVALLYWRVVQRMLVVEDANAAPGTPPAVCKKRFFLFSAILVGSSFLAFLYPIFRFTPAEKYKDIAFGLVLAFFVLGGVAKVMLKLKRMLDADEKRNSIGNKPE